MPIACNPGLEANQRGGKVSVKQSQALSRRLPEAPDAFSFIILFDPTFPSSRLCSPGSPCVSQLRSGDGAQAQRREIPRTTALVTDTPKPAAIPILTLYFAGKHLLCSLAQKLASNLPPHSCLVTPIRVHTVQGGRRKKGEKGKMENEGIEREGQGQIPESHKAKPEPLAKTNKKTGLSPIDMHKQGPSARLQLRQRGERKERCSVVESICVWEWTQFEQKGESGRLNMLLLLCCLLKSSSDVGTASCCLGLLLLFLL